MPVDVLDRRLAAPGDVVFRDVDRRGDLFSLGRRRRPTIQEDGPELGQIEAAAIREYQRSRNNFRTSIPPHPTLSPARLFHFREQYVPCQLASIKTECG